MNVLATTRRENLCSLGLSPKELAVKAGRTYSYWNDLMKDGKKSFGEKAARSIEESLELPNGWLDVARSRPERLDLAWNAPVFPDRSVADQQTTEAGGPVNIHMLDAQPVSRMVAWKELHMHDLPNIFRMTLRDDSLAPDLREGDYVELQRDLAGAAATGDWVLVRAADDSHYLREFISIGTEGWVAAPVNKVGLHQAVTSKSGAIVVAVYIAGGVVGRKNGR